VRHLETPGFESFVPDGEPVAVKVEQLDAIPATIEKEEEMAAQRVLPKAVVDKPAEAVKALSEVDISRAEKDPDSRGERNHKMTSLFRRLASPAVMRQSHSGSGRESRRSRT
jgi:hypothetical protein